MGNQYEAIFAEGPEIITQYSMDQFPKGPYAITSNYDFKPLVDENNSPVWDNSYNIYIGEYVRTNGYALYLSAISPGEISTQINIDQPGVNEITFSLKVGDYGKILTNWSDRLVEGRVCTVKECSLPNYNLEFRKIEFLGYLYQATLRLTVDPANFPRVEE